MQPIGRVVQIATQAALLSAIPFDIASIGMLVNCFPSLIVPCALHGPREACGKSSYMRCPPALDVACTNMLIRCIPPAISRKAYCTSPAPGVCFKVLFMCFDSAACYSTLQETATSQFGSLLIKSAPHKPFKGPWPRCFWCLRCKACTGQALQSAYGDRHCA